MVSAGDELGRSQQGNNNAYCQDNELSWMNWDVVDQPLLDFTRRTIAMRRDLAIFRRREWLASAASADAAAASWLTPGGQPMTDAEWDNGAIKSLMLILSSSPAGAATSPKFAVLFNGYHEPIDYVLPRPSPGRPWRIEIDTRGSDVETLRHVRRRVRLDGRSLLVLSDAARPRSVRRDVPPQGSRPPRA
jgi:glycogen operon protein